MSPLSRYAQPPASVTAGSLLDTLLEGAKTRGDQTRSALGSALGISDDDPSSEAWLKSELLRMMTGIDRSNNTRGLPDFGFGGIIKGSKLATPAERKMLDIAKEAEAQGLSDKKIWQATQWYRDKVDKRWRIENPDPPASEAYTQKAKTLFDDTPNASVEDTIKRTQADFSLPIENRAFSGPLEKFYNHPVLKQKLTNKDGTISDELAIPGIKVDAFKNAPYADKYDPSSNLHTPGGYFPGYSMMPGDPPIGQAIDANAPTLSELRYVLAHELQHGVQDSSRIAGGMNAKSVPQEAVKNIMESAKNAEEPVRQLMHSKIQERNDLLNKKLPVAQANKELEALRAELKQLKNINRDPSYAKYMAYYMSKGETEARNVSKRVDLAPDDRMMSYPPSTEDVPIRGQWDNTKIEDVFDYDGNPVLQDFSIQGVEEFFP